jgi:integrase
MEGGQLLTAKRVERAKPGRYHDGHGLYLQVRNTDNKSWLLRYERDGRERWYGLGPAHTFSLKEARLRARAVRQLLHDGIDPIEDRKAKKAERALAAAKAMTFRQCAEAYIAANEGAWKNAKHTAQWSSTLKGYVYPHIGHLAVADIDTGLVLRCIEPIWPIKTETASRIRGRIESILDWAAVRKYRPEGDNPARWTGHLEHVLPAKGKLAKVNHHAALPYAAVPAFVEALRQREGMAARALEFAIFTAARTGEVIGAKWDELDLNAAVWKIPAGRMKGGREHTVPLSKCAIELLRALPSEDGNDHVFIGPAQGAGLSNMAMTAVLRRMGRGDVTVHGFRSSFRDWAAECTNYPNHVVEMALAHAVGDRVEAAYRRGDLLNKRKQLAEAWARYCSSPPVAQEAGAKVVPMGRGRQ